VRGVVEAVDETRCCPRRDIIRLAHSTYLRLQVAHQVGEVLDAALQQRRERLLLLGHDRLHRRILLLPRPGERETPERDTAGMEKA
jgi:hypothetical protein